MAESPRPPDADSVGTSEPTGSTPSSSGPPPTADERAGSSFHRAGREPRGNGPGDGDVADDGHVADADDGTDARADDGTDARATMAPMPADDGTDARTMAPMPAVEPAPR